MSGFESLIGLSIIIISAFVNGFVVWGVVKTKLEYITRDTDRAHARIDDIQKRIDSFLSISHSW